MKEVLFNQLVMVWIYSSVIILPFVGLYLFGHNLGHMTVKILKTISTVTAFVSLLSFAYVGPTIVLGVLKAGFNDSPVANVGVILFTWIAIHMGCIVAVISKNIFHQPLKIKAI